MHEINDLIVHHGTVVLTHLPYADGQHVRVTIDADQRSTNRISIEQIRQKLKGCVERFDDPVEPGVPPVRP